MAQQACICSLHGACTLASRLCHWRVSKHRHMVAPSAGGTANKKFTIDVSDYIRNVINGRTDSRTRAAFAIVRVFRYNAAGGGTFGYPADSLGSNQVVCATAYLELKGYNQVIHSVKATFKGVLRLGLQSGLRLCEFRDG